MMPDLAPVYLVIGDEDFLVRQSVQRISDAAMEGGLEAFNKAEGLAEAGVAALLQRARTPPMMGPRRVVLIKGLQAASLDDQKLLLEYIPAPEPTTVLILTGEKVPPPTGGGRFGLRIKNAVKKAGKVIEHQSKDQDPVRFIVDYIEQAGCKILYRDASLLVELVGRNLGTLESEAEKLICFVGGKGKITSEQVEEVCSLLAEAVIFSLTDAIIGRQPGKALAILHRIMEEDKSPSAVLPLISWQMRQLILLQRSMSSGVRPDSLGVRIPSFKIGRVQQTLKAHPLRPESILEMLAEANQQMHGHKAGPVRIMERLVLQLASA